MTTERTAWMGWAVLLGAALVVLAESCSGSRTRGRRPDAALAAGDAGPGLELWVDAHAPVGGDGSSALPLRRLEQALALPAERRLVHLAPGLYPGPFVVPDGTELVGGSAAVLTGEGPVTVLEANGAVTLKQLLLQGGQRGIRGTGELHLADVRLSGQRGVAISIGEGAGLEAEASVVEASVSEGIGLSLEPGARARLAGCTFEGPWRRGIQATGPQSLVLERVRFRGAVTGVHLRGGRADLSDVTVSEGRGPALYVVGGAIHLLRVQVTGHEYALLTGTGATVEAEDFTSSRADRAGVGVSNAKANFTRLTILRAGTYGGLQGVASELTVKDLRIEDVAGHGISMRNGSLHLEGAVVRRTQDPDGAGGDGLHLRSTRATISSLRVEQTAGACLVAAEGGEVTVVGGTFERCHTAGLVAETGARLTVESVTVKTSDGPAAVAAADGQLSLRGFKATSVDGLVWAECATGARVTAWNVLGHLPALPCVERLHVAPHAP